MKQALERLTASPAIDGGFVASVSLPVAMKAHFEAAYWRGYLPGQIQCWHGCAMLALRSGPKFQAIGTRAGRERWAQDRKSLRAFRRQPMAPFQLRFTIDSTAEWERLGTALGVPALKLLQAALATRYFQSIQFEKERTAERQLGIETGTIIPLIAACAG